MPEFVANNDGKCVSLWQAEGLRRAVGQVWDALLVRAPDMERPGLVQRPQLVVVPVNLDDLVPAVGAGLAVHDALRLNIGLQQLAVVVPDPDPLAFLVHVLPWLEQHGGALRAFAHGQAHQEFAVRHAPRPRVGAGCADQAARDIEYSAVIVGRDLMQTFGNVWLAAVRPRCVGECSGDGRRTVAPGGGPRLPIQGSRLDGGGRDSRGAKVAGGPARQPIHTHGHGSAIEPGDSGWGMGGWRGRDSFLGGNPGGADLMRVVRV